MIEFPGDSLGSDRRGDPTHELTLGGFDLVGRTPQAEFTVSVLGDDASWGSPQAVTSSLKGLMRDGARVALDSWENREVRLRVEITAPTGDGLADGEAALFAELGKRNTLTWTPPGGFSTPTVFDVQWSELDPDFDDVNEALGIRVYGIVLTCLPFARSATSVLSPVMQAPAPPSSPTVVTVDDGTSASSWAASHSGVVSSTGGAVRARWNTLVREPTAGAYHLARNAAVTMTGTRYLRIEWASIARPDHEWLGRVLTVKNSATEKRYKASDVVYQERQADGRYVSWLDVGTAPITQIGLRGELYRTSMTPAPGPIVVPPGELVIYDVKRTDQIMTSGGTGHQVSLTIPVSGSAPTQGSIHLWDQADTNLGDVMLYTGPRNGMASLEPFVTTATAPMGGTVSGTSKDLSSYVVYDVPATMFDTNKSSGYLLMGRLNSAGSGRLKTSIQSIVGVYGDLPILLGPVQSQYSEATAGFDLTCLGAFTVPPLRVDGKGAGLRVTLWLESPTGTPFLDDVWLVDIESGSLTWVDREGAAFGHLWIEPPSVDAPLPRVRIGAGPNGAVGWEATPKSCGQHEFPAGEVHMHAVATEAAVSKVQTEYFPRWHTHARSL